MSSTLQVSLFQKYSFRSDCNIPSQRQAARSAVAGAVKSLNYHPVRARICICFLSRIYNCRSCHAQNAKTLQIRKLGWKNINIMLQKMAFLFKRKSHSQKMFPLLQTDIPPQDSKRDNLLLPYNQELQHLTKVHT